MVQASGRLGFTGETAIALNLKAGKFAKFAKDDENEALYLIIINESSEDAFSIRESSGYFYVPTKVMFDTLGYDYENNTIMFDLVRQISLDKDLQGQVYFMKPKAKACVVYNDWRYLLAKVRKSRDNTKQNANKC